MMDRTPTKVLPNGAIRYGVYDEAGNLLRYEYIKPEDEPTQVGTPFCMATMLKVATAAQCGLGASAVPDDVFLELGKRTKNSLARDLNIMLNQSLGTSNIDAWADLLSDSSRINTAASSNYSISGGVAQIGSSTIGINATGTSYNLGDGIGFKVAQSFTATSSGTLPRVTIRAKKVGTPAGNLVVAIASGTPDNTIATSTTSISAANLTTSFADIDYLFSSANITAGQTYYIVVSVGSWTAGSYYVIERGGNIYADGTGSEYTTSTYAWNNIAGDFYLRVYQPAFASATIVWNAVTATETFIKMAVSADRTLSTGTITFYVSHNGTTWTQITALNSTQVVSFTGTSVYLKAVITGNALLSGVAWGGY